MPLTLTLTEGVLPAGQETVAYARLAQAMLRWHGLEGNALMAENVVGAIHVLPQGSTFTGLRPTPVVFIEWKVPAFAFTQREVQRGYCDEATTLIHEMSGGRQPRERIFINVVHAVDGAWNFGGQALTNAEIGAAVQRAGEAPAAARA